MVELYSHGGDFPEYPGPINQLIYYLGGPGLPFARGEAFEFVPELGNHGDMRVTRFPTPDPLAVGATYNLSTRATFTIGSVDEADPVTGYRSYDIAGDFVLTAGTAVLGLDQYGELVGRAPAMLRATLTGYDRVTRDLLFSHTLHGRGSGQVFFSPSSPDRFYYTYQLDPVPEPATLLLVGSGLGWVAVRTGRRRRGGA